MLTRARTRLARMLGGDYARMLSATAIGHLAVVATTPLVTRLYAPEAMGVFMVLMSYVGVASYAVSWRLELALVSERDDAGARSLLALCLSLIAPMSVLCGAACLLAPRLGMRGPSGLPPSAAVAISLILVVTGLFTVLRYWHVRRSQFTQVASGVATQGLARAIAPLAAALWRADWLALCLSELGGRLGGISRLARGVPQALSGSFRPSQWRLLLRRYWKFPGLLMPSSLLDALAQNAAVPAVAIIFGASAAGHFALALRVGGAGVALFATSAGDVVHARGSLIGADERARFVAREARRLALLGALVFIPGAVLAPLLARPVLGPSWQEVGWMFAIVSPCFWVALVVGPLSRMLLTTNRIELKLIADVTCLFLPVGALFAAGRYGLPVALAAMTIATVVAYGVYFALICVAVRRARARSA